MSSAAKIASAPSVPAVSPDGPTNIAAHLPTLANRLPDAPAVSIQTWQGDRPEYETITFRELNEESDALAAGLTAVGIGRGVRTVLMVKPSRPFFSLTFALFKAGAVPILIDPGIGRRNLKTCIAEAEPSAFIGIPKAHLGRLLLRWGRKSIEQVVWVGMRLGFGGHKYEDLLAHGRAGGQVSREVVKPEPRETAAVLFTSGSTGPPKGAVYTHEIFGAQVESLKKLYDIQPGERDLSTFPLFALFGPALGMAAVVPDMDATRPAQAQPERLVAAIKDQELTNMFGSPALVNTLSRYCEAHGLKLPTLKRVISAGAPVPPKTLARMQCVLTEGVEVYTPYGATESLPVANLGSQTILNETAEATAQGKGVCVGKPAPGMRVRVIRISDDPIETWTEDLQAPPDEIGELIVQGPVVTRAYYNREEATALHKIMDPESAVGPDGGQAFWHRMGDVGYLDEQGRIWMCGRKSHRVQTKDGSLFTVPVEGIFNAHPAVFRTALVGVGEAGEQTPVLCVELEADQKDYNKTWLKDELLALAKPYQDAQRIEHIFLHPAFPVDIRHNAKIFREQLAGWAAWLLR